MKFIYVTLDLRRALYVPEVTGAIILCSYKSDLLEVFRKKGYQIFCFEEVASRSVRSEGACKAESEAKGSSAEISEQISAEESEVPIEEACLTEKPPTSSAELIGNGKSLQFLKSLNQALTFLVFKPSNKVRRVVESQGWKLISSDVKICRKIEDKLEFAALANHHGIQIPRYEIHPWKTSEISQYQEQFGNPFLVQSRIGHAGSSTWVIQDGNLDGPNERGGILPDMPVKISEFIHGPTFTLNGYASPKGKLVFGPLFEQLMNVPAWNEYAMGTIGVSPVALPIKTLKDLQMLLLKLSPLFQELGFFGFFGVDLIFNGKNWYLIECNPRFTASISLQCFLDLQQEHDSLLKLHATLSEPQENIFQFISAASHQPQAGHIILRNTTGKPWIVPSHLRSGIYRLVGENWQYISSDIDAKELTSVDILFVLAHESLKMVSEGSDIATLLYRGSAFEEESLRDLFFDFYERVVLGYRIRPKDFLHESYLKIESDHMVPVFADPSRKKLQTELFPSEVVKKLGDWQDFLLIEKADGTKGWVSCSVRSSGSEKKYFHLLGEKSLSSTTFLKKMNGTRYRYGGVSEQGVDCSGFVQCYFWEVKGKLLPKHSQDQRSLAQEIDPDDARDDDLVFLLHAEKKRPHVGLLRNGNIWHSSLENGVQEEAIEELQKRYKIESYGRILS